MSKEDNFTKERLEELEKESLKEANVDSLGEYLVTSLDKGDKLKLQYHKNYSWSGEGTFDEGFMFH
jgi:hypothetical protein